MLETHAEGSRHSEATTCWVKLSLPLAMIGIEPDANREAVNVQFEHEAGLNFKLKLNVFGSCGGLLRELVQVVGPTQPGLSN